MIYIDLLGYLSMGINLMSMSMTHLKHLRLMSMTANSLFATYGYLIQATPIVVAASIAVSIHSWKLLQEKRLAKNSRSE